MSTAGRKRRGDLWAHFTFDDEQNKTKCKACGAVIRGKNTNNLKRHLQTSHPDIFSKVNSQRCSFVYRAKQNWKTAVLRFCSIKYYELKSTVK